MLTVCPPVRCHHAVKAPLAAQDILQKLPVLRRAIPVYNVVGGHNRPRLCLLHNDLKGSQINLPDSALRRPGITVFPVRFLIIKGKMLDCGADTVTLDSAHHRRGELSCKERVLRIILEIASAERAAVNIDGRRKPHGNVVLLDLRAARFPNLCHQLLIPRARKLCRTGPRCRIHAAIWQNAQPRRTVRCHDIRDSVIRQISPAKCVGNPSVWLSAQQMRKLFIGELRHKLLQCDRSLCHFF